MAAGRQDEGLVFAPGGTYSILLILRAIALAAEEKKDLKISKKSYIYKFGSNTKIVNSFYLPACENKRQN